MLRAASMQCGDPDPAVVDAMTPDPSRVAGAVERWRSMAAEAAIRATQDRPRR